MAISALKISVIVAVYNQDRFVPGLLSSLEAQDCPVPYEVIVCDDGSSDTTRDWICAQRRLSALNLRYIWQPDGGFHLGRSRNNGIRCAQGDILVFVDGDSWLRPFFLREHWEAHHVERRLVCGGYQNVEVSEGDIQADCAFLFDRIPEAESTDLENRIRWIGTNRPWMACTGGNQSVRRAHAVPFDEQFQGWGSEDRDFAFRLYDAGLTIHLLDRTGVVHLRLNDRAVNWNPYKGGDQRSIISALESKLHLYHKYPGKVMMPSLNLVRYWHLDEATDTWRRGPRRKDESVASILAKFETWRESHNP
jgi:cellulose synthase/poly-beta-1,6-N-acetylglucosamine synthase-like glycosyltransferase